MEKQTKIELTLAVAQWFEDRERIMLDIEVAIHQLFLKHKREHDDHRRTGCFHVELSLPKIEYTEQDILNARKSENAGIKHDRTSQTAQAESELDMNAAKKREDYWCCAAPFGVHEPDCKNYIQVCTRDHICVLASAGPCNGFPRGKQ